MTALIDSPYDEDLAPRVWQIAGACTPGSGVDPEMFFSERAAGIAKAKEVCLGCVARSECLTDNLAEPYGIYGATTPRDRKRMMRGQA